MKLVMMTFSPAAAEGTGSADPREENNPDEATIENVSDDSAEEDGEESEEEEEQDETADDTESE